MTLGNRISTLRKQKNYSQEYLAEQMEVSRQAVSKWENDLSSPDTGNLIRLAELLGVSVDYLAAGTEDPKAAAGEVPERLASVFHRIGAVFFAMGLTAHCIGLFSGLFTRNLIPFFPYFWYGTSAWAILLNAVTVLSTAGWISVLAIAHMLRKKR